MCEHVPMRGECLGDLLVLNFSFDQNGQWDATESNAQRNKLSLQATTSSGISHFRKTHLKRREVVMARIS